MTDRIALFLALVVIALLALDALVFNWTYTLFLLEQFARLIEYTAFWR